MSAERPGRLTQAQTARFIELLEQLPITVDPEEPSTPGLVAAGRPYALSSYDAVYLTLASLRGLPLATNDDMLRTACENAGVPLA